MFSLQDEMTRLFFVLDPPVEGASVFIQFIAATGNEGVSTIARQFALTAVRQIEGKVLLLDLNLSGTSQYNSLMEEGSRLQFGNPSGPTHIMQESKAMHKRFSSVWVPNQETVKNELSTPMVSFHQIGEEKLFVTRVNEDMVKRYGKPRIYTSQNYWNSLTNAFQMIIVDSPPLSSSYDGLAVCKMFDASILVISAERTRRPVARNLRDRILDNDGHIAGTILNHRKMHIPRFLYKLL